MNKAIEQNLISAEYLAQISELHANDDRWGTSGDIWATHVAHFAQVNGAKTILDYGCGKGGLVGRLRHILPFYERIVGYDPAIEEVAEMPVPVDVVVSTDVLEHIEPDLIDNVLDHIAELAVKGAFFVIATNAAKAVLPDGRNAHLIQEGEDFWLPKVQSRFKTIEQGSPLSGRPELVLKALK
jgi:2-polyprenyl-3-methyl-5-hydroxy-6-metoxy-1,4-benzoquinol methylase